MPSPRKITLFLGLTFVASWTIALTFAALGGDWATPAGAAVWRLFTLPPFFAALIVKGPLSKDPILSHLGLSLKLNRWWMAAWLIPPLIAALAWLIGGLFPGVEATTDVDSFVAHFQGRGSAEDMARFEAEARALGFHPALRMLMQSMVAGITLNAFLGLGEELGWRGFLHHELRLFRGRAIAGFWRRSIVVGLIWGLWHLPVVAQGHLYPEHPLPGIAWMMAWCVTLAPIFSYLRERSGSVFAVAITSGTLTAIHEVPLTVTRGGSDVVVGITGASGIAAAALVLLGLWAHDRYVAGERIMVD